MTKRKSIENGRAEAAFRYVQDVKNKSFADSYKSYVKRLAAQIKANGLGNTLAFVYSKTKEDEDAYSSIYEQLEDWLKKKNLVKKSLLDEILSVDSKKYKYITKETLALLNWWRRFVDGEIESKDD